MSQKYKKIQDTETYAEKAISMHAHIINMLQNLPKKYENFCSIRFSAHQMRSQDPLPWPMRYTLIAHCR